MHWFILLLICFAGACYAVSSVFNKRSARLWKIYRDADKYDDRDMAHNCEKLSSGWFHAGTSILAIAFAIFFIFGFSLYLMHSRDLGTLRAQDNVITVYMEKTERLKDNLKLIGFDLKNKVALLNADSPVASIVKELAQAENDLARAKEVKAAAKVNIAMRAAGPFNLVVTIMGKE